MGTVLFSIPPDFVVPKKTLAAPKTAKPPGKRRRSTRGKATIQWEAADGTATGAPIALHVPPAAALEYPDSSGRMGWKDTPASLSFSDEPPEDAVALRLSVPGKAAVKIPRAALTAKTALAEPQKQIFGLSNATLLVPVFSERFVDKDAFMAKVGELHSWTIAQAPFDREPTRSRIALVAHFWSSDPDVGLFGTSDDHSQGGQLFYGDREIAKRMLAPWMGTAPVSLILINSTKRGGAGGQPGYSAWTSIAPAPGERWENVCLHEIGHGLGLADEYLQDPAPTEPPAKLEPNVSRNPIPSQTPWRGFANLLPDAPAPSFTIAGQNSAPADAIGTFQGARYKPSLYRSSRDCLMRDTRQSFCIVCQKHIETVLSAPLIA